MGLIEAETGYQDAISGYYPDHPKCKRPGR